jgi:type IV pilus assembly protein PilO
MAISIDDIKKMSPQAKAVIIVLVVLIIGYLYFFYFLSDAIESKTKLDKQLEDMQGQIREKEKIAMQFDKYKTDVGALKENYKVALLKLPDQREIPGLFHSVAMSGRDAGIEFSLFEPKAAIPKTLDKQISPEESKAASLLKPSDQRQTEQKPAPAATKPAADGKKPIKPELEPFYEEIPVGVTVTGSFQSIVFFFEKVAKLPRIINISDITMGERKDVKGRGYIITTNCTIKTYMFVDKKEKTSEKVK